MSDKQTAKKLHQIDSLRGVAILMVIVTHVCPRTIDVNELIASLCVYGRMGVQLFFVMSALTLCLSSDSRRQEHKPLRKFLIRRYFRIAPVYYIGIILYTSLTALLYPETVIKTSDIILHIALLHAFSLDAFLTTVPGGWSIGVECAFYLAFPYLYRLASKSSSMQSVIVLYAIAIVGAMLSLIILNEFYGISEDPWKISYWNIFSQLPVFITGFMLFKLFKNGRLRNSSNFSLAIGFIVLSCISLTAYRYKFPLHTIVISTSSAASFIFLYFLFERNSFLNPKFLQAIGKASFSMYIFHFVVMSGYFHIVETYNLSTSFTELNLLINYIVVIFITYLIAFVSMNLIENRFVQYGRLIIRKMD